MLIFDIAEAEWTAPATINAATAKALVNIMLRRSVYDQVVRVGRDKQGRTVSFSLSVVNECRVRIDSFCCLKRAGLLTFKSSFCTNKVPEMKVMSRLPIQRLSLLSLAALQVEGGN